MSDESQPSLPHEDRREILRIARVALKSWLRTGRLPPGSPHRHGLIAARPCAIALHGATGALATAGHLGRDRPLYLAVEALVAVCGTMMPAPLRPEDVAALRIEVALAHAVRLVAATEVDRLAGEHGVRVVAAGRAGVVLPGPATRECSGAELASAACRAASLDADAWRAEGARITAFTIVDTFADPLPPA